MADLAELLAIFSVPRQSASAGERRTLVALQQWLQDRKIGYETQSFRLFPYSNELIGVWLILSSTLLLLSVILRLDWPILALVGLMMALVTANVVLGVPLVVWPIATTGQNILLHFGPDQPERTLLIATHYDSKTELFDHTLQGRLFGRLPLCIGLAVLVLVLELLDRFLFQAGSFVSLAFQVVSLLLALPVFVVVGLVGVNLLPGRLIAQSSGAVDNGAACVILLGLAERLAQGSVVLGKTQVTLAFFGGEEVSMQGSRAFVRSRPWNMPTAVINLELLGQNGPYVTWQSEGNVLTSAPTDPRLSEQVRSVVADVTGQPARPIGGINSDGYSFILVGLPTCVLGSYDRVQGGGGLHRPTDAPSRVELGRLAETIQILEECVQRAEAGQLGFASDVP